MIKNVLLQDLTLAPCTTVIARPDPCNTEIAKWLAKA